MKITHLTLSWSTSRGRDTYGYNIARLDDMTTGKRYRCNGGGYDTQGTVFADWLTDVHQDRLQAIADRAASMHSKESRYQSLDGSGRLYGMHLNIDTGRISIDGACGLESVISIAKAAGLEVQSEYDRRPRSRGTLLGFYVSKGD